MFGDPRSRLGMFGDPRGGLGMFGDLRGPLGIGGGGLTPMVAGGEPASPGCGWLTGLLVRAMKETGSWRWAEVPVGSYGRLERRG
jgi:hypothetical protein